MFGIFYDAVLFWNHVDGGFFSVNLTLNVVAHLGSVCGIMWKNWSGLRVLGVLLNLYFLLVAELRLENAAVRVFSALNRNSYLFSPSHSI